MTINLRRILPYILKKLNHFIYRIKKYYYWFKLIYSDRDYDYVYLLKLLKYKLQNMETYLRTEGHIVNSNKYAKEMRIVISHIDHYINVESFIDVPVIPCYTETFEELLDFINKPMSNEMKNFIKRKDEKERYHWEEIWRIISKKGRSWWD